MKIIVTIDNTGKTRHKISVNKDHVHILMCKGTPVLELRFLKVDAKYLFDKLQNDKGNDFYKHKIKMGYHNTLPIKVREMYINNMDG